MLFVENRKDLSDGEIESDVEQPGVIHNISSSGALASLIDYESDEKDLEGTEKDKVVGKKIQAVSFRFSLLMFFMP